jgi:hypothetical protein
MNEERYEWHEGNVAESMWEKREASKCAESVKERRCERSFSC